MSTIKKLPLTVTQPIPPSKTKSAAAAPLGDFPPFAGRLWLRLVYKTQQIGNRPTNQPMVLNIVLLDFFQQVLQWAREHGCPWDSSTCREAGVGGRLDVP